MDVPISVSIVLGVLTALALVFLYYLKKQPKQGTKEEEPVEQQQPETKYSHSKGFKTKRRYQPTKKKNLLEPHPLLAANFKGHTDEVHGLSFDTSGKYLASISKDYTLRVWVMKTIDHKEKKSATFNVSEYYYPASCVAFSPDGKAVLVSVEELDWIKVVKVSKSGNTVSLTEGLQFSLKAKRDSHVSLDIASNGSYILMCNLTAITLWSIKGDQRLADVTTNLSPNNCAIISPCCRFIACCGFTTSVKIYEVEFDKDGEFQKVTDVMSLNGHSASVVSVHFSADSKRVATVSKDKTCRVWDIDVRYKLQEETRCIKMISLDPTHYPRHVAISPDSIVIAIAINTSVWFYSLSAGELLYQLQEVHNDCISALVWSPSSSYLATAGGKDRYIRLWHNVPGMREKLARSEEELKSTKSGALKDRLKQDIEDLRNKLEEIQEQDS